MAEVKEDRRIKRTKRQLSAGLIELMKNKNIKDITIKELVEKVDINRSTFYLHYSDIYDLLNDIEKNLMEEVTSVFNSYKNIEQLEDSYAFLLTLFKTFDNNRELCKILMNNPNSSSFMEEMEENLEAEIRNKLTEILGDTSLISPNSYIFYRCGCTGLLKYWITNDSPEAPEEMAKETYHLVVDSLVRIQEEKSKKQL